jgi:hypothetical protein
MKTQRNPSDREVLAGLVERVTYHNVENGFCVLRAKARGWRSQSKEGEHWLYGCLVIPRRHAWTLTRPSKLRARAAISRHADVCVARHIIDPYPMRELGGGKRAGG